MNPPMNRIIPDHVSMFRNALDPIAAPIRSKRIKIIRGPSASRLVPRKNEIK